MNKPRLVTTSMQISPASSHNKQQGRYNPCVPRAQAHPPHTNMGFSMVSSGNKTAAIAGTNSVGEVDERGLASLSLENISLERKPQNLTLFSLKTFRSDLLSSRLFSSRRA